MVSPASESAASSCRPRAGPCERGGSHPRSFGKISLFLPLRAGKLPPRARVLENRARSCKWVISMALSRQHLVAMLRRAGLHDAAAEALATLPEQVTDADSQQFCAAHGLSLASLMERMGGSP